MPENQKQEYPFYTTAMAAQRDKRDVDIKNTYDIINFTLNIDKDYKKLTDRNEQNDYMYDAVQQFKDDEEQASKDIQFIKEHNDEYAKKNYTAASKILNGEPLTNEDIEYLYTSNSDYSNFKQDLSRINYNARNKILPNLTPYGLTGVIDQHIETDPYNEFFSIKEEGDNNGYDISRTFNLSNRAFKQIRGAKNSQEEDIVNLLDKYIHFSENTHSITIDNARVINGKVSDEDLIEARKAFTIFSKLYYDYFGDFTMFQNTADAISSDTFNGSKFNNQSPDAILRTAAKLYDKAVAYTGAIDNIQNEQSNGELLFLDVTSGDELAFRGSNIKVNDFKQFTSLDLRSTKKILNAMDKNGYRIYGPENIYTGVFGNTEKRNAVDNKMSVLGEDGGARLTNMLPFIDDENISIAINPLHRTIGLLVSVTKEKDNKIISDKLFIENLQAYNPNLQNLIKSPYIQGYMDLYTYAQRDNVDRNIYIGNDTFKVHVTNADGKVSYELRDKDGRFYDVSNEEMIYLFSINHQAENLKNKLIEIKIDKYKQQLEAYQQYQIKNNQPINIDEFNTRFERSFMTNYVSGSEYEKQAQAIDLMYNTLLYNIYGSDYNEKLGEDFSGNNGHNFLTYGFL